MSRAGRPSERRKREIATGGKPARRLVELARELTRPGTLQMITFGHDDGCPCLDGGGMHECTCEVVEIIEQREIRPDDKQEDWK